MTSLVDAPVLACDLARTPAGGQVADVLLQALSAVPRPDVRSGMLDLRLERLRGVVRKLDRVAVDDPAPSEGLTGPGVETRALAGVRLLGLQDITAMLVLDVLPDDPLAALAAADAVAGHIMRPMLDRTEVALLLVGWSQLAGPMPAVPELDGLPDPAALRDLLEQLQTVDADTFRRVHRAYRTQRRADGACWAPMMHVACRAVAAAGLARPVAAAQLAAVRALLANTALHPGDRSGVMPAITAHVQALAGAAATPREVCERLSRAWTGAGD